MIEPVREQALNHAISNLLGLNSLFPAAAIPKVSKGAIAGRDERRPASLSTDPKASARGRGPNAMRDENANAMRPNTDKWKKNKTRPVATLQGGGDGEYVLLVLDGVISPRRINEGIPDSVYRGAGTTAATRGAVASGKAMAFGKIRGAVHAQLKR